MKDSDHSQLSFALIIGFLISLILVYLAEEGLWKELWKDVSVYLGMEDPGDWQLFFVLIIGFLISFILAYPDEDS